MGKKIVIGFAIATALIAVGLCTFGAQLNNNILIYVGLGIGALSVISFVILVFSTLNNSKETSKGFEEFYQTGDYEGGVEFYKKKLKGAPEGPSKEQSAYYLMTFYFLLNDLEAARDLFGEIEFDKFKVYILYYDILLDLYDGMVGDAREKYNEFMEAPNKELKERKEIITEIFDFIDNKIETINIKTDYPIIKDVLERYASD